uniref:DNA replication and repair protein RecF n=1 Tax=Paulinella longichromatophora TaxID=1708747 RepID=A0A2H4ZPX4_9EUKA|nr:putative DNA repair and genetic recombination protein RecF [Paulinella longichromatophora]
MRLHHLELEQFRNYQHEELRLESSRLLVLGNNAQGKSNLLEAIELLGTLRSHRSGSDLEFINQGKSVSIIRGITSNEDLLELEFRQDRGRQVRRNGKRLDRQNDLLRSLRCVTFSALDLHLLRGEPAQRRQWLDKIILQLEPVYSELIRRYGKLLKQRSQLLRKSLRQSHLHELLDIFDQQQSLIGVKVHRRRYRALNRIEPLAAYWQEHISNGHERLRLVYQSGSILPDEESEHLWRETFLSQLQEQREQELRTCQCTVGPHRDEINVMLDEMIARRYASSGQQRSIVLALKMAELDLISKICGESPILILDDVMAELDQHRQELLLDAIREEYQCLVSATSINVFTPVWHKSSQIIKVISGKLISVEQN